MNPVRRVWPGTGASATTSSTEGRIRPNSVPGVGGCGDLDHLDQRLGGDLVRRPRVVDYPLRPFLLALLHEPGSTKTPSMVVVMNQV